MKVIKYSLPKQIANDIEQEIKNGTIKVGEKLPTEPELVEKYGASRNTIREAVQSLIHAGILESKQGNGTYVVANDRFQVDFFNLMQEVKKSDVAEVRVLLEEYIVESAIMHLTDDDISQIQKCLSERNGLFEKIKENTKADIEFHISIAYATHNILLIKLYQYVSEYFSETISATTKKHIKEQEYIDALHNDLTQSIISKDVDKAKKIIKEIINL